MAFEFVWPFPSVYDARRSDTRISRLKKTGKTAKTFSPHQTDMSLLFEGEVALGESVRWKPESLRVNQKMFPMYFLN